MKAPGWITRDTTQEQRVDALIEPRENYPPSTTASRSAPACWGITRRSGHPGRTVIWDEASVALLQVFLEAGDEVAAAPTLRRRVVRRGL
jgi:hypothetical protein